MTVEKEMVSPRSREDVSLQGEWENILFGEQFLLCDDGNTDKITVFATSENLKLLLEANSIYADGDIWNLPQNF